MKAAAPMMGGIICPPVEAVASVAAAICGLKPAFFMIGMVKEPEATVLATEEPEIIPCSPEAATAALAGPPVNRPAARKARSLKNWPMLVRSSTTAKKRNRKMKFAETWMGVPKMPAPEERKVLVTSSSQSWPRWEKTGSPLP